MRAAGQGFAAGAGGEGVTVRPVVQVTGGADVRWLRAGGLYVTMLVGFLLLERRWRPGKTGKGTAARKSMAD